MEPRDTGFLAGALRPAHKNFIVRVFNFLNRTPFAAIAQKCVVLILLLIASWTSAAYASSYVYDSNGRLVAVTSASGSTVVYSYDAVGNILSIQPIATGQLALFVFTPQQGIVGATVTLQGNGFSTTPSNNTVKFNGTVATVTSATVNQLVVTVPSGATSGPVSVTVSTNTVTSTTSFFVFQTPSISSFTPTQGDPGTAVTVNGAALDPVAGGTLLTLGGNYAGITSASNTQLAFSVPLSNIGSGPIQVTTPYGQAVTNSDFIVVPAAITAANVVSTAQLAAGGASQSLNINTTNKYGLFVFPGIAGQFLSIQLSSLTTTPSGGTITYYVYSPTNHQIATGTVSTAANMSIHLPIIPITGTYLVAFAAGNHTVQLTANLEVNATLNATGASVAVSTTIQAQSKRLIFTATAGQSLALGVANIVVNPSSSSEVLVTVKNPDGSYVYDSVDNVNWNAYPCTASSGGCGFKLLNLAQTGTYSVIIQPNGAATMSLTATLSADVATTLNLNTPYSLNLQYQGQEGLPSFTATAGQTVAVQVSEISTVPANTNVYLYILKPNGSVLTSASTNTSYIFNLANLAAGTYQLLVAPQHGVTATMAVTVQTPTNIPINGTSQIISTTAADPVAYLSFSGTAGQNLGLGLTNLTLSAGNNVTITAYKPDGTYWTQNSCYTAPTYPSCQLPMANLPQTGTYQIIVTPATASATMSFNVLISPHVTGTLTLNTPFSLSIPNVGQEGLVTFTLGSAQSVVLQITGVATTPAGSITYFYLFGPGKWPGGSYSTYTTNNANLVVNLPNLAAGTYTLEVDSQYGSPTNATLEWTP
jgi:trimeric autotransporter adhesin